MIFNKERMIFMKNKVKIFLLAAGVISLCTALVCLILRRGEEEDENPMFI